MCVLVFVLCQAVRTPLGAFQQVTVCNRCEGQGQSFQSCERCGGDGRERETKRIQLTVPAGAWVCASAAARRGCHAVVMCCLEWFADLNGV